MGQNIRNNRLSSGQRAGFIKNHRVDAMQLFKSIAVFEQHAQGCTLTGANHNGNRRCKSQRTRAGNDQHGNCAGQRKLQAVIQKHPCNKGDYSNRDYHRNENTRNPICQSGDGRLRIACLLHEIDHLL